MSKCGPLNELVLGKVTLWYQYSYCTVHVYSTELRRMTLKMLASVHFYFISVKSIILTPDHLLFHENLIFHSYEPRNSLLRVMESTEMKSIRSQNRSLHLEQRLQALSLAEHEIAAKIVQIITEVSIRSISDLKKKARQRDYDSLISRVLKTEYVVDDHRSDRSLKVTSAVKQVIVNNVRADRNEREKCFAYLNYEHEISSIIILRVLKRNEFRSCKSIMKSDLNAVMMKARLQFCLRHKN
jgi:hypothetical protein